MSVNSFNPIARDIALLDGTTFGKTKLEFSKQVYSDLMDALVKANKQLLTKHKVVYNNDGSVRYTTLDPVFGSNLPIGIVGRVNTCRWAYAVLNSSVGDARIVDWLFAGSTSVTKIRVNDPSGRVAHLQDPNAATGANYGQLANMPSAIAFREALLDVYFIGSSGVDFNGLINLRNKADQLDKAVVNLISDPQMHAMYEDYSTRDKSLTAYIHVVLARFLNAFSKCFQPREYGNGSVYLFTKKYYNTADCLLDNNMITDMFADYVFTTRQLQLESGKSKLLSLSGEDFAPSKTRQTATGTINVARTRVYDNIATWAIYDSLSVTDLGKLSRSSIQNFRTAMIDLQKYIPLSHADVKGLPPEVKAALSKLNPTWNLGNAPVTKGATDCTFDLKKSYTVRIDPTGLPVSINHFVSLWADVLTVWDEFVNKFFPFAKAEFLPKVSVRAVHLDDGRIGWYRFDFGTPYRPTYRILSFDREVVQYDSSASINPKVQLKSLDVYGKLALGFGSAALHDDGPRPLVAYKKTVQPQCSPIIHGSKLPGRGTLTTSLPFAGSCNLSASDWLSWKLNFVQYVPHNVSDDPYEFEVDIRAEGYTITPPAAQAAPDLPVILKNQTTSSEEVDLTKARVATGRFNYDCAYVPNVFDTNGNADMLNPLELWFTVPASEIDPSVTNLETVYRKLLGRMPNEKSAGALLCDLEPLVSQVRIPHYNEFGDESILTAAAMARGLQKRWVLPAGFDTLSDVVDDAVRINSTIRMPRYVKVYAGYDIRDLPQQLILKCPKSRQYYYKAPDIRIYTADPANASKAVQKSVSPLIIYKDRYLNTLDSNIITAEVLVDLGGPAGSIGFTSNFKRTKVTKHYVEFEVKGPFTTMPVASTESYRGFIFKDTNNVASPSVPLVRDRELADLVDWFPSSSLFETEVTMVRQVLILLMFAELQGKVKAGAASQSGNPMTPQLTTTEAVQLATDKVTEMKKFNTNFLNTQAKWAQTVGVNVVSMTDTFAQLDALLADINKNGIAKAFEMATAKALVQAWFGVSYVDLTRITDVIPRFHLFQFNWADELLDKFEGVLKAQAVTEFVTTVGLPLNTTFDGMTPAAGSLAVSTVHALNAALLSTLMTALKWKDDTAKLNSNADIEAVTTTVEDDVDVTSDLQ